VSEKVERLTKFVAYATALEGDEKGEAQVFCDRLFQAFGHKGYKEAGASLEYRVKKGKRTKFADLLWRPRMLLEMKSAGEKLEKHYQQAFEYWLQLVPHRPRYVVLCNFNEFWIYDFDAQLHEPVDRVALEELPQRYPALNFLFPEDPKPQFGNDRVAVTRAAAAKVARVFNSLTDRDVDREKAQRFVLQCVVALFSEDIELLPRGLFTSLVQDSVDGADSAELIGGLFKQMNSDVRKTGGRYKDVPYFNGGLYEVQARITLETKELDWLADAATEDWSKVEPGIFGTLFQASMDQRARHAHGAHYTHESEIQRAVLPTIVRPWQRKINEAKTLKELLALRRALLNFKVLDPACGSGNFLYLAYRELKRLELSLAAKVHAEYGYSSSRQVATLTGISTKQFFGFDIVPFAVELAKVTLMLGKKLALDEAHNMLESGQANLPLQLESALPLDNLNYNIRCTDALFSPWPKVDAIIGNPPFQSHKTIKDELGDDYVDGLHQRYPDIPGKANYCVYWFRRAHDELPAGGRAGLIGTNNIRSNESRKGGLDHIVADGGTITEGVSSQVWSGDAAVHVSIVNWVKGEEPGKKKLFTQMGNSIDSPWKVAEFEKINSSLSYEVDVSEAKEIEANQKPQVCFQGQTHGDDGFLLAPDEAASIVRSPLAAEAVHPYLTGDNLLRHGGPTRFVVDLNECDDVTAAMRHGKAFEHVKKHVLPEMEKHARKERQRLGSNKGPRQSHFETWWKFWRGRRDMISAIEALPRYIVCVRHTLRPIFEFIAPTIHPNDALTVFALADDYSFGILQSDLHWAWFKARCSTIAARYRYTSETVFDCFPWPQSPTRAQVKRVASAAVDLRGTRGRLMKEGGLSLRELYRSLETPGEHELKNAHLALDSEVVAAYGMKRGSEPLEFLLELNQEVAGKVMASVVGPGLPPSAPRDTLVTKDCVSRPVDTTDSEAA
jgi:SAM-dependent methyltransferase